MSVKIRMPKRIFCFILTGIINKFPKACLLLLSFLFWDMWLRCSSYLYDKCKVFFFLIKVKKYWIPKILTDLNFHISGWIHMTEKWRWYSSLLILIPVSLVPCHLRAVQWALPPPQAAQYQFLKWLSCHLFHTECMKGKWMGLGNSNANLRFFYMYKLKEASGSYFSPSSIIQNLSLSITLVAAKEDYCWSY